MPIAPTYPGVYVEESPSGVRTITGVATSITAFIGRTRRGPVEDPITINSHADFERIFGGLYIDSPLSYSVRDFFLNGGAQAVVVRLHNNAGLGQVAVVVPKSTTTLFSFAAASEGSWSRELRVRLDRDSSTADLAGQPEGITLDDLYNLTVTDRRTGVTERFVNLTFKDGPQRMDRVLAMRSQLLRLSDKQLAEALTFTQARTAVPQLVDRVTSAEQGVAAATAAGATAADAELAAAIKLRTDTATDGGPLTSAQFLPSDGAKDKKGLYSLDRVPSFNLLCIPPHSYAPGTMQAPADLEVTLIGTAAQYAERRRAMLIVDPPASWDSKDDAKDGFLNSTTDKIGTRSSNAMMFFPRLVQPNPLRDNQMESFAPSGAVAGLIARTDTSRGIWKAAAGIDATLVGVPQLSVHLTDQENGELNQLGLNCLRALPEVGRVLWGARTLQGSDRLASQWKYVPVRRLALFIEESLYRGTQWVVFEPNGEALWSQIRLNIGVFMNTLFRQSAFAGTSAREAYFVKCDRETTTQADINRGIVNIVVGFAPLKPAEFVVIQLQQIAGQLVA